MTKKLNIFVIISLDDIPIYIKNSSQLHINTALLVFEKFRKHDLFANFKKC